MTWEMDLRIMCEDAEKKGEEKGRLEGEKEKALMIAQNLKKLGTMSDSEIAEVTSLPLPEVAAL